MGQIQTAVASPSPRVLLRARECVVCQSTLASINKRSWCFRHKQEEISLALVRKQLGPSRQVLPIEGEIPLAVKCGRQAFTKKEILVTDIKGTFKILSLVCQHFRLTKRQLLVRTRKPEFVEARYMLMYLLYKDTPLTMVNIGEIVGGMNYSTVVYAIKKITKKLSRDASFGAIMQMLRSRY